DRNGSGVLRVLRADGDIGHPHGVVLGYWRGIRQPHGIAIVEDGVVVRPGYGPVRGSRHMPEPVTRRTGDKGATDSREDGILHNLPPIRRSIAATAIRSSRSICRRLIRRSCRWCMASTAAANDPLPWLYAATAASSIAVISGSASLSINAALRAAAS